MRRWQLTILLTVGVALAAAGLWYLMQPRMKCDRAYSLLTRDGSLFITVVFGYKDSRPLRFVGDRYERAAFVDSLIKPCQEDQAVCGFTVDAGNPEFFTKKLMWLDGKERVIQIQVLTSSVGPDDEWNRASKVQQWHSDRTYRLFRRAITKSDIVFYNGHSRTGGGPDFFPPQINKAGMVQYKRYQEEKQGLKDLIEDLERTKSARQPRLLGLFSCASNKHFQQAILKTKPKLGVIASEALLYQADAMDNMLRALEAVLRGECEPQFNKRLRAKDPTVGSKIVGFF